MSYRFISKQAQRTKRNFSYNPTRILALSFIILIFVGSLLLSLPIANKSGQSLPYLDALFTATSAVCVTGLVVVDTGETFTVFGQLIILVLIQVGGLGLMTFASLVAIALGRKISFKQRLVLQETLSQNSVEGVVRLVRYVLVVTFISELAGTIVLGVNWFAEMGWKAFYYSLFHSVSAFNNAGFDLMGGFSSLTAYTSDWITNVTIMFLFIAGGLGFFVIWDLYLYPSNRKLSVHTKIVLSATGTLLIIAFIGFFLLEYNNVGTLKNFGLSEKIITSAFMASTPRTAGFSTVNIGDLTQASLFFTMILMFIGASPGSTGGGIKTTTFIVLVGSVLASIKGQKQTVMFKRSVPHSMYSKANAIFILSLMLIVVAGLILLVSENSIPIDILFEVVSAFGTVGLSTGITPELSIIGKLVITVTMFVGRVGPLTLAYGIGQQKDARIEYPKGNILIG